MIDIGFDEPIKAEFIDPFWQKHSDKILSIRRAINFPKTIPGEKTVVETQTVPVFLAYTRLRDIFPAIVSLLEYDEIFILTKDNFFRDPVNQSSTLKAFALVVEDAVKFPQQPGQLKNYDDHLPFFNHLTERLKKLDETIKKGTLYPNIVGSLIMIYSQSVNKIPGIKNFHIKTDQIRKKIRDYLPAYEAVNSGQLLQTQVEMIKQPPRL